jgi:hypothetical protein
MVWDVKMEDFRRKVRFVAGGHMTETPAFHSYLSVVSYESVCITLTLAALNDLEVKTTDIENAYLSDRSCDGKLWSLYGLKSSGTSFRNHLADCM